MTHDEFFTILANDNSTWCLRGNFIRNYVRHPPRNMKWYKPWTWRVANSVDDILLYDVFCPITKVAYLKTGNMFTPCEYIKAALCIDLIAPNTIAKAADGRDWPLGYNEKIRQRLLDACISHKVT